MPYFLSGIRGANLATDHGAMLQVGGLGWLSSRRFKDWRTWIAVIVALVVILVILLVNFIWSCYKRARCDSAESNGEVAKTQRQTLPLRRGENDELPDHEDLLDMPDWETRFLVEEMGVSGMAMLDLSKPSGVNGLPLLYMLPIVAVQACLLQGVILYHMALMLRPRDAEKTLPRGILFAAIYLHFINCVVSMPFCLAVLRIFHNLHRSDKHLVVAGCCFVLDAFVIPIFNLVIGALYLCTSVRVEDLILNSCAVAFISNIDNWILELNDKINAMVGGRDSDLSAFKEKCIVPVRMNVLRVVNWSLCVIPVVPLAFSFFIVHLGFDVMRL